MLSSGTRIGPYQVESWIKEGSCGQSYRAEGGPGEEKGKIRYLKLFHRELSDLDGFSDFFAQECRAIQQLEGRGIWPMISSGVMKWKHWMAYKWFEGKTEEVSEDDQSKEIKLRTLNDWMEFFPDQIGPNELKDILIDLHCGLYLAHNSGVIHGNIKPSNVLINPRDEGTFESWVSEFALYKISCFQPLGKDSKDNGLFSSQSLQFQESLKESQKFRPSGGFAGEVSEEKWDIFALGGLARYVLDKSQRSSDHWLEWQTWADNVYKGSFTSIAQSMEAIPGVTDISQFGIKGESNSRETELTNDEIRKKREIEWERKQKIASAKFRRNLTALVGILCLFIFLSSKIYLFFSPSPWVEYTIDGASDRYQLGFGIFSGKAWGILPASYDEGGEGGQDVAGEWQREGGMFLLKFRKFKQIDEEESGKKLWQFIGKGSTSEEDYYIWTDYLSYDSENKYLKFIKRVHDDEIFIPGVRGNNDPNLFSEVRIRRSGGVIKETELIFRQTTGDGPSWSVFIGIGFLLASLLYHRIILTFPSADFTAGKD